MDQTEKPHHIESINSVSKSIVKFSEFLFHVTQSAVNLTNFFCNLFFFYLLFSFIFDYRLRNYQFLLHHYGYVQFIICDWFYLNSIQLVKETFTKKEIYPFQKKSFDNRRAFLIDFHSAAIFLYIFVEYLIKSRFFILNTFLMSIDHRAYVATLCELTFFANKKASVFHQKFIF